MKTILALGTLVCAGWLQAAEVTSVSYTTAARDWQRSSLTGNGTIGAMARGAVNDETISLSHCKLFLPRPGQKMATLVNHPRRHDADEYLVRDGYMAACDLKLSTRFRGSHDYVRRTEFLTGECVVETKDDKERPYNRRVVAFRPSNLIGIKIDDAGGHETVATLCGITPGGFAEVSAFASGVKSLTVRPDYYRCDFAQENPWNKLSGYEVALARRTTDEGRHTEIFLAIEPIWKGETSHLDAMRARLDAALEKGYDALLAEHAPAQAEVMKRVSFELEGPADAAEIMNHFQSGRYNILSSTGGDQVPNLQGLWAGTWSAPWFASFTLNGNLPCAIAFNNRGNTPEYNESLLKWLEARLPEMRASAKFHFNARGFRAPAQTTVAGVETDSNAGYPHVYWHGGAPWMLSRLYDGYRHTLDRAYLKRIYPLMKEVAQYYEDVIVKLPDGTMGFTPSYSPENTPGGTGQRPTAVNATMEVSIAKQFLGEVADAAETLGVDAEDRAAWRALRAQLTPYRVSEDGFFAEWLAPGLKDNNEHRHASHFYALYDEAAPEIVTNAALVAAIRKSIDARMDFNENRSRTMSFGYVQNGLAACKIGDAERAERALKLLNAKNWLEGGGSSHDWQNIFNTDISGGYDYLIADMLVYSGDTSVRFLPAKPASWTRGAIRGLHLRGNVLLRELAWENDAFTATLALPDGTVKTVKGRAGDTVSFAAL